MFFIAGSYSFLYFLGVGATLGKSLNRISRWWHAKRLEEILHQLYLDRFLVILNFFNFLLLVFFIIFLAGGIGAVIFPVFFFHMCSPFLLPVISSSRCRLVTAISCIIIPIINVSLIV